ncbi:MAG: NRDE family protein [Thermoanaerobaculia bacterium]
MCTVSWFWTAEGYQLFGNRDESRSRRQALPPRRAEQDGVAYLAPVDADAGGTWIAANELGVTLTLLNFYQADAVGPRGSGGAAVSRGRLVQALAGAASVARVGEGLRLQDLARFRPFTLLALEPGRADAWQWDGRNLSSLGEQPPMPLISSGVTLAAAIAHRRASFEHLRGEGELAGSELHLRFHASHWPEASSLSVCMHRPDAETQSLSWVRVERHGVLFSYAGGSPCRTELAPPVELPRGAQAPAEAAELSSLAP